MDTQQHIPPIMHRTFSFFLFPFFLLLLLLPSCGRQGGTAQAPAPAGDTVPLRYATGFDIVRHGHFRELLVYNPWQPGAVLARYYLAGDDTTRVPADGTRLRTPLRHVALTSVTHVEFMRLAGVLDRVDGLCSPRLAYNATLRSRAEAGDLADLGDSFALNVERALALRPQAVMASAYNQTDAHLARLSQAGIPVVYSTEWMEKSLPGRAEWVKFVAALYDREELADSLFDRVADEYERLAALARQAETRPRVMAGSDFRGTWYMPGGDSFMAHLFADAGADYFYADDPSTGSLPLNMETVLAHFAQADVWLNCGYTSMEQLLKANPKYALFRPVHTGRVYHFNRRTLPGGANDFWESAVARPDLLLADVIATLHPGLLPGHEPVYTGQLPPAP